MRVLVFVPVVVSNLLLAAHFYRSGFLPAAALFLLFPGILIVRHRLVPRLLTFFLLVGGVEWLRTLYLLTGIYQEAGRSSTRLIVILLAVSTVTVLTPLVFRSAAMRKRYRPEGATGR